MAEKRIPKDKLEFRRKKDGSGGVFPINKETGEIGGTVGKEIEQRKQAASQQKSVVGKQKAKSHAVPDTPSRPLSAYIQDAPDLATGCQNFYRSEYQGRHVTARNATGEKIKVKFTGKAEDKLHDIITEAPECAKVLPLLPTIIQTGKCLGQPIPITKQHKWYGDFIYFYKRVDIDGKPTDVIVDVGRITSKGAPAHEQYNYSTPDRKDWEKKKKALERAYGKFASDASTASRGVTTPYRPAQDFALDVSTPDEQDNKQEYEIVNIRIIKVKNVTDANIREIISKQRFISALVQYLRRGKQNEEKHYCR